MVRSTSNKTYIVDRLWDRKIEGDTKKYLTSWDGYEEKTWEPVDQFSSKPVIMGLVTELDQILDDPNYPKPEWYRNFIQLKRNGTEVIIHEEKKTKKIPVEESDTYTSTSAPTNQPAKETMAPPETKRGDVS